MRKREENSPNLPKGGHLDDRCRRAETRISRPTRFAPIRLPSSAGAVFDPTGELIDVPPKLDGHEVGSVLVTAGAGPAIPRRTKTADD